MASRKKAFFFNVPCITMRDETEWVETIEIGWNIVVGASKSAIINAYEFFLSSHPKNENKKPYGSGYAARNRKLYFKKFQG